MPERKCDYPLIVRMSQGKATCPEKLFVEFKARNNCQFCPKVATNRQIASDYLTEGEKRARDLVFDVKGAGSLARLE